MKSHASMNRIYRLVWNAALNLWVAVAENAKGRSKGGRAGTSRSSVEFNSANAGSSGGPGGGGGFLLSSSCRAALVMFSALGSISLMAPVVHAEPSGGVVSAGSGSISQSGTATTINQATQRLAIDWNRFSTAANESVVFVQPNAQAIALNRVTGSTASTLLGSLTATGQVFVLNPNGVLFGAGSQVNVGGLVASTLNMSNADFMAGNNVFTNSGGTGSVVNQGTLTAAQGGYIALLAPDVRNEGVISATLGTALLAAGNKVTLNLNNGSLLGFSIDEGALNALADNKQLIQANGGQVLMSAKAANALSAATVNNTGIIEAKTLLNQNGVIKLIGDMQVGQTNVAGRLDASAPNGGDGGFIETSAARVKVADGTVVTTLAASGMGGNAGTWLIDPTDFTISAGSSAQTSSGIGAVTLSGALAGGNVNLLSSTGDINVNDQVGWNAYKLTLTAGGSININANLNGSGSASLALVYATYRSGDYNIASGVKVNLPAGFNLSTQRGENGKLTYMVVNSLGVENDTGTTSLQGIKNNLNGLYALGADVDAAATAGWAGGFAPVGDSETHFSGSLAGLGHSIKNLTIDRPSSEGVGLFGALGSNGVVRDLKLDGGAVSGGENTGAMVGKNFGQVYNAHSSASVTGSGEYTGGLVGYNDPVASIKASSSSGAVSGVEATGGLVGHNYGTITDSYATGAVMGTDDYTGGLAGENGGTITQSYATGSVQGTYGVGGLVGANTGSGASIDASYATGNVDSGGGLKAGGLVGYNDSYGMISNSYASGNVSGGDYNGGLVGFNAGTIGGAYATGNVSGTGATRGGLIGYNENYANAIGVYSTGAVAGSGSTIGGLVGQNIGYVSGAYWDINTSGQALDGSGSTGSVGLTTAQFMQSSYLSSLGFYPGDSNSSSTWWMVDGSTRPFLRSEYRTTISNAHELQLVAINPSTLSVGYKLANNIDMAELTRSSGLWNTSKGFVSIGMFGNNFTDSFDGRGYTVSNLMINRPAETDVGLFGYTSAAAVIKNISLAGGSVSGDANVGALVGTNLGRVEKSHSNITVAAIGATGGAGGLVGENEGVIDSSSATGAATGLAFTGGLVGSNDGDISFSYATGLVSGGSFTGGLVGQNGSSGRLANVYASGNVTATSANTGGLVGINIGSITNAYATGSVTSASTETGGLVGQNSGTVNTAYATGSVSGSATNIGGLTGLNSGEVDYGYWDKQTTGQASSSGSVASFGKTTAQMKQLGTFDGFSIEDAGSTSSTWRIYDGNTNPLLRSFLLATTVANSSVVYNGFSQTGSLIPAVDSRTATAASGRNVGIYKSFSDQQGFDITDGKLFITQAGLTISAVTDSRAYDGTTQSAGVVTVTGLKNTDTVSASQKFASKNAGSQTLTIDSGYTVSDGNLGGNYLINTVSATGVINKALLSVTAGQVTKGYDGTTTAGGSGSVGTLAGQGAGESIASAGSQAFLDKNAGSNKTVRASGVAIKDSANADVSGNYTINYVDNTSSTINKALLSVTAGQVTKGYDGTTTAGGSGSVGTLAGQGAGESIASAGSQAFLDKNAGSNKTVRASGVAIKDSGNADVSGNYTINYVDNTSSTINKALLSVTAGQVTKGYDGTTTAGGSGSVGTLAGQGAGESIASAGSQAFLDKNAGSNKTVRASGVAIKDSANADVSGNYTINYVDNTSSTINKALLSVTAGQVTKGYDGTTTAGGSGSVGTLAGQGAGESIASAGSQAFLDKNAGSNKTVRASGVAIKDSANADVSGNYTINYVDNTSSTINKALLSVTAGQVTKGYDGTTTAGGSGSVGTLAGQGAGESIASAGSQAFLDKNAGSNKTVRASGVAIKDSANADVSGNYTINYVDNTSSTINKALLSVTAGQVTKGYDGTTTAGGSGSVGTLAGQGAGESIASAGSQAFLDKNAGSNKTVRASGVAIKDSGNADVSGNYTINYVDNTSSTINKALLSVTAGQVTKGYDGTTTAGGSGSVGTLAGQGAGESIASAGSQAFLDKNAGSNKTVRASGVAIKDSANADVSGNYTINYVDNTSSTINKALLSVTAGQVTKGYDGTTTAGGSGSVGTLAGQGAGESIASAGSQAFLDKNAGSNKTVRASGVAIKDSANADVSGNYTINYVDNTSSTINKALLSVTAGQVTKGYDGTTTAGGSGSVGTLAGQGAGESIASAGSQAFLDKNAGSNKTVRASGVAIKDSANADVSGNYTINYVDNTSSTINKALLSVTAGQVTKGYDGTTTAGGSGSVGTLAGQGAGESIASAGSQAFLDKNAGSNKTVRASGVAIKDSANADVSGNYTINYVDNTSSTINKALLSVTAGQVTKGYDGTTTAGGSGSVGTLAGQGAGESIASAGSQAFLDKNAGSNKTVRASGVAIKDSANADVSGNYTINYVDNTSSTINKALLSVTAGQVTKGYDGTTTAGGSGSVGTLAGQGAGESIASAGSQAFLDKNAGSNKTVRASGVAIKDSANADVSGNYTINYVDNTSSTINKALLSVTAGQVTKGYDGTTTAGGSGSVGTLAGQGAGESIASAGSQAFLDKNAGSNKTVRASGVAIKDSGNADVSGNYTINYVDNTSSTINKALLSVTAGQVTKGYDGTTTAGGSGSVGTLAGQGAGESIASAGSQAFLDKNAGSNKTVRASGVAIKDSGNADVSGNYTINYVDNTSSTINKALLSVTAGQVTKGYDGTTTAGGSGSVGTLAGQGAGESIASAGSQAFLDKNAGSNKTVRASGVAIKDSANADVSGNYTINYVDNTSSTINKALLTIAPTGINKIYDGTTAATVNYNDSRFGNDNIIISGTASYLDKNAGTAKTVNITGITATGNDIGNYVLSTTSASTTADITKRSLTVSGTGTDKVYDGTTVSGAVTLSDNRILNDNLSITSTGASFADKNAGIGKAVNITGVSVSGNDAGNYSFGTTGVATATITPRALSVAAGGLDKVYDGTTDAAVVYRDNRLAGDSFTVGGNANFLDKNVATGNIFGGTVVTTVDANGNSTSVVVIGNTVGVVAKSININGINLTGTDAGNYTANTTAGASAKITPKALTIAAVGDNKVYDGSLAATATLTDNRAAGDALTTVYGAASFGDKNVGTGKTVNVSGIGVSGADLHNYTYTGSSTAVTSANITARDLTVSASAFNKVYDGTVAGSVVLGDNRVAGDVLNLSSTQAAFTDKNAGTGKTVNVSGISVAGLDAGNYTFNTAAAATASITPKALGYTVSAASKEYDGNTSAVATVSGLTGLVGSETVNVSGTSATFNSKNVVSANRVTVNSATLSDGTGLASNYSISGGGSAAASITAKALTVSASGVAKTYDGNTSATVSYSDNRIGSDVLTVGGNANYVDKNAATGKTVNVSGINLSGQDASNYALAVNTATTTADIARRALQVNATGVDKVYDGMTSATVLYSDNRVANDVLSVTGSANYADKNAGLGKTVSVTGITLGSTDANNYTVNTTAGTTAGITPKALTYSTAASGKVYDGNTSATASVSGLTGFVGTETVNVGSNSATFNSKDVGVASQVTVNSITLANGANGGLAGNYQIAAGGTAAASISAKALSYTTGAVSKEYDGTATGVATLSGLTGLVGSETVTATANATFNSKDVGVANLVTVNAIALGNGSNGGLASNYSIAAGGTAAAGITAKTLAYSVIADDKVYDGNTSATASLSLSGLVGSETVNVASNSASFNSKNVLDAYLVTVNSATLANGNNGGLASNYSISGGGTANANITAKLLTYDTVASSKVYDGSVNAVAGLSIIAAGLVNNETVTAVGNATFNSKNVATANLVTVNSAALVDGSNGGLASNYRVEAGGTAAAGITRRGISIAATGVNKVYDGTLAATAVLSDNRVAGDVLTSAYSAASYVDKNVATGKTVNVSGIAISGADADNYTQNNTSAVASASITPRALVVGATGVNKVYDGTAVASATLSDNRVANDALTASYSAANYLDKNVANGKTVNVNGISLSGADAINYTFNTSAVTSASITPKALNISATGVNKVYDGTTAATVAYADNRVAGDVLSIAGSASFVDKNAGSAKTVNVSGITLGSVDAGNYSYNTTAVASAAITPKALSVVANNDSRFFSGLAYSGGNGVTYSGLVAGETSAVLAGSLSYSGSSQGATAAGNYAITPGGLSASNYTLGYVNGVLSIGAADATIAALGGPALVPAYGSVLQGVSDSPPQGQPDPNGVNGFNINSGPDAQPGSSLAKIVGCGVSLPPGVNTASCQ